MPRITWPTRRIQANTLALVNNTDVFSVSPSDANVMIVGSSVTLVNGGSRSTAYITLHPERPGYRLATDADLTNIISPVPPSFILERDVGLIVNYPRRPMLKDPGVQTNTSVSNPMRVSAWTLGEPRFEGSVTIEVVDNIDVPVVEAFIDQLHDPEAWFELPLPGSHLRAQNVTAYSDGAITIAEQGAIDDTNLQGWFGRVGRRTIRVVSDVRDGTHHVITIVPALIDGTTAQAQANSFSNQASVRVRAVGYSADGDADFGAVWSIEWEETRGDVT